MELMETIITIKKIAKKKIYAYICLMKIYYINYRFKVLFLCIFYDVSSRQYDIASV